MIKKFFKTVKVLIGIIFLGLIVSISAIFLSTMILEKAVLFVVQHAVEDIAIQTLAIAEHECNLSGKFLLDGVSVVVKQAEEEIEIDFKKIELLDFVSLIFGKGKTEIVMRDGTIKTALYKLDGLDVNLVSENNAVWEGPITIEKARCSGFIAKNIAAQGKMDLEEMFLSNIHGEAYDGNFKGEARVTVIPQVRYEAKVIYKDLDTFKLREFNDAVFSQARGKLSGDIQVSGPEGGIETLRVNASLSEGSEVKGRTLVPLLSQIPNVIQKKELQRIIANDENIIVEIAQLQMINVDANKITTDVQLDSKEMNLDMNVTVDIIVEKGLNSLLEYVIKFSNPRKGL